MQDSQKSILESINSSPSVTSAPDNIRDVYYIPNFEFQGGDPVSDCINEFRLEAIKLCRRGRFRAKIYKGLDVLGSVSILMIAAIITFVSLGGTDLKINDSGYIAGILGILTAMIEGGKRVFRFSTRGNTFELVGNRSFYLAQRSRRLVNCGMSEDEIFRKLDEYYIKLGNLDMSLYDSQVVNLHSGNVRESSQITSTQPVSGYGTTSLGGLGSVPGKGNIMIPRKKEIMVVDNSPMELDDEEV